MPSKTGIRDVKKRLRYIAGHLGGVERMIDAGRDPAEIHVQLRSLAAALQAVLQSFEIEHRNALGRAIADEMESCPGPCERCSDLEALKRRSPRLNTNEVLAALQELQRKDGS